MKKILLIVITLVVALLVYVNVNAEEVFIPADSIRFRVVANSNSINDQSMKVLVKEYINDYLMGKLIDVDDSSKAKSIIKNEVSNIEIGIENIFKENNYNKDFTINYGSNFFPIKLYKGVSYDSGFYDSLVITIGDGKGDNWWCVLFPPLCLLEGEKSEISDVEYKFFVKELINNIFE